MSTLGKHWKLSEEAKKHISEGHKGIKLSEEHKRKISKTNKGKRYTIMTDEIRKKISNTLKKYFFSPEARRKLSEAFKGNKSPKWKGGITPINIRIRQSVEFHLWHKAVLERDNFTCQVCGQRGGDLVAHHINNFAEFPDKRFAIDNGITLCKKCHLEFHKKYGFSNNTKEQLEKFLTTKLNSNSNKK